LLIEFSDAGFELVEIVHHGLELRAHGVHARAGIGLDLLHGLGERAHAGVQFVDAVE
jgi:hypothetical protein